MFELLLLFTLLKYVYINPDKKFIKLFRQKSNFNSNINGFGIYTFTFHILSFLWCLVGIMEALKGDNISN